MLHKLVPEGAVESVPGRRASRCRTSRRPPGGEVDLVTVNDAQQAARRRAGGLLAGILVAATLGTVSSTAIEPTGGPGLLASAPGPRDVSARSFERNEGQSAEEVEFLARAPGYTLFLTSSEAALSMEDGRALRMVYEDANAAPVVRGLDEQPGVSNYLVGRDASQWITDVPHFASVGLEDLWPGVDMTWFWNDEGLVEYAFTLSPGADPSQIRLGFDGADDVRVDDAGRLVLALGDETLVQRAPVAHQDGAPVDVAFELRGGSAGFRVGAYDASRALVIDPVLDYSTYLGRSEYDVGYAIATDDAGSAYVAGETDSPDFPVTEGAFQTTLKSTDAFVAKMAANGSELVFATYLGGTGYDTARGLAVDASGAAYVAGTTYSADFPLQDAFQTNQADSDGFVTKLAPDGASLVYSTYYGGDGSEFVSGLAVDSSGAAYVTGSTNAVVFPTTPGAFQTERLGLFAAFVGKLLPNGSGLAYSTLLTGYNTDGGRSIAVDGTGAAYVIGDTTSSNFPVTSGAAQPTHAGGSDVFIVKMLPNGSGLAYGTFLGGSGTDEARGIAVASGAAYVTGDTESTDFPATPGAFDETLNGTQDAYVAKLDAAGGSFAYATFLGGSDSEFTSDIAADAAGAAYVVGSTYSSDFPVTADALQTEQPASDGILAKVAPDGASLAFSTYIGGSISDAAYSVAIDAAGAAYVAGVTFSSDFPTTPGAFQTNFTSSYRSEAFVMKILGIAVQPIGPKLAVDKQAPASVRTNSRFDYIIVVNNTGDTTAPLVRVGDILPAGLALSRPRTAVTTTQGSCTADGQARTGIRVSCSLGALPVNASATIVISVRAGGGARTVQNTAGAQALTQEGSVLDTATDTATTNISRTGGVPLACGKKLTGATGGSVDLRWEPVEGAVEYQVLRALAGDGSFEVVGVADGTSFADHDAEPEATYEYRVHAILADGREECVGSVTVTAIPYFAGPLGVALAMLGLVACGIATRAGRKK